MPTPARLAAAVLAALVLSSSGVASAARPTAAADDGPVGRYLVRYADDAVVRGQVRSLQSRGVGVRATFTSAVRGTVVRATPAQAAALARTPGVAAVEPDRRVHLADTRLDPPWGLDRVDQRTLPLSGSYTPPGSGAGVTAYVVDTGVRPDHAELAGRVGTGWSGVGDGRGSADCNGHGTHVAGTLAGSTYGVAGGVTVVPVRVLGCDGSGYLSGVVAGLDWVAAHHPAGVPAVVNLSLGGAASPTLDAALRGVLADGVTAVVAAGNEAADACTRSPARVAAALTVAASSPADRQASFSNRGPCVDLHGPGVGVLSAWHTSGSATATLSGTSMAAPHVAGAAALVLAAHPAWTPTQVSEAVVADATAGVLTAVGTDTPNRLLHVPDAAAAEPGPATVPAAPTGVSATAGRRAADVSWTRGDDGGSPLTGQLVGVYAGSTRVGTVTVPAGATRTRVGGLRAGVGYAFTVAGVNAVGRGPESARSNVVVRR